MLANISGDQFTCRLRYIKHGPFFSMGIQQFSCGSGSSGLLSHPRYVTRKQLSGGIHDHQFHFFLEQDLHSCLRHHFLDKTETKDRMQNDFV